MYCTTPSGTRYQTGSPAATRARHSVDEMASAGISTRLTLSSGRPAPVSRCPGRVQPTLDRADGNVGQPRHLLDGLALEVEREERLPVQGPEPGE